MSFEREVLDYLYDSVWALMQTRNQLTGDDPWPEESREAAVPVMAATVGYLANAAEQLDARRGADFRRLLADIYIAGIGAA